MIKRGPPPTDNFTVFRNATLNADLSCEALGVQAYLLTKPANWIISPTEVENRFKLSPYKRRKIFDELTDYGVLERVAKKDRLTGQFKGWDYILHALPKDQGSGARYEYELGETDHQGEHEIPEVAKIVTSVDDEIRPPPEVTKIDSSAELTKIDTSAEVTKNGTSVNPTFGFSQCIQRTDLLQITEYIQNTHSGVVFHVEWKNSAPSKFCPDDFDPDPAWVETLTMADGVVWQDQLALFKKYEHRQPKTNWYAAFESWLMRTRPAQARASPSTEPGSATTDYLNDIKAQLANRESGHD